MLLKTNLKLFIVFVIHLLASTISKSQSIQGMVVDGKSGEPLPFANVYINNSTVGATTTELGEFNIQNPPSGNIELIASYVGYVTARKPLTITKGNIHLSIELVPDEKQLNEIEVVAKKDKAWDEMYTRFERAFLGTTTNANHSKILNPWVIDVSEKGGLITATAGKPIEIENKALGYIVDFDLKEFAVSDSSFKILGYSFFNEMEREKKSDPRRWKKTRELAYEKSLQNVFLSIIEGSVKKNGLELYRQLPGTFNMQKTQWFYEEELGQRVVVAEPDEFDIQPVENGTSLKLPEMLEIHFNRISTRKRVYRDVPFEISWIMPNSGRVLISKNGLPADPGSLSIYGYMASLRIADLMPIDYQR